MDAGVESITGDQAKKLYVEAIARGERADFIQWLIKRVEDPVQPIDEQGRRKWHPMLWGCAIFLVLALASFVFFTYYHF